MAKVIIDPVEAKNRGISKKMFFYLLGLYYNVDIDNDVKKEAWEKGYNAMIGKNPDKYEISYGGIKLIERILLSSQMEVSRKDEDYEELAKALINLYPDGIKPGTTSMWRGSLIKVIDHLRWLEYKTKAPVDKEKAIKATKRYIAMFRDDNTYMQTLPYFIFKCNSVEGELMDWQSNLQNFIENDNTD